MEIARLSLLGEDWIFSLKGYIERRQGRWEECVRDLERSTELDPRNVLTLQQLALTYQQLRRYVEQKSTHERILAAVSSVADNWLLCAFAERNPAAAKTP